jgi:ArsR family transcriptional regulator
MKQKEWVKIFKALSNENRLKILAFLWPNKELSVADIAGRIRLSLKSTSKHLVLLKNVGFLQSEGKAKSVYYSINPDLSKEITSFLHLPFRAKG